MTELKKVRTIDPERVDEDDDAIDMAKGNDNLFEKGIINFLPYYM